MENTYRKTGGFFTYFTQFRMFYIVVRESVTISSTNFYRGDTGDHRSVQDAVFGCWTWGVGFWNRKFGVVVKLFETCQLSFGMKTQILQLEASSVADLLPAAFVWASVSTCPSLELHGPPPSGSRRLITSSISPFARALWPTPVEQDSLGGCFNQPIGRTVWLFC